jgi:isopentenyl phosphate kinase
MTLRPRRPIVVLKVGGSLITDRRRYRVPRLRAIDRTVRAIRDWRARGGPGVMIVLGGGAFGHNVVHRHGIDFGGAHRLPCELFELTAALYELKVLFARVMRRHGLPSIPLQESSLFVDHDGIPELTSAEPIEACFAAGYIPLVTGGLISGSGPGFRPISSDRVTLPLCGPFDVQRVAMLTDQPGVMRGNSVIRTITPPRFDRILSWIAAPTKLDVTGGMRGKVAAAIDLARAGVETVIADGTAIDARGLERIFSGQPPGTLVSAFRQRR